jgi:hypothetical protein
LKVPAFTRYVVLASPLIMSTVSSPNSPSFDENVTVPYSGNAVSKSYTSVPSVYWLSVAFTVT